MLAGAKGSFVMVGGAKHNKVLSIEFYAIGLGQKDGCSSPERGQSHYVAASNQGAK